MTTPLRILLQTTIEPASDDWSIARFSVLRGLLEGLRGDDGAALYEVTARDRAAPPGPTTECWRGKKKKKKSTRAISTSCGSSRSMSATG